MGSRSACRTNATAVLSGGSALIAATNARPHTRLSGIGFCLPLLRSRAGDERNEIGFASSGGLISGSSIRATRLQAQESVAETRVGR
jgi:hypothetical protein